MPGDKKVNERITKYLGERGNNEWIGNAMVVVHA